MRIGRDEANAGIACDCLGSDLLSFFKAERGDATRGRRRRRRRIIIKKDYIIIINIIVIILFLFISRLPTLL